MKNTKNLYKILHDLDCELQMLGVRSDWGIFATPQFASETLVCCLAYLAKQRGVGRDFLLNATQDLLDTAVAREKGGCGCFSMKEMRDAHDANNRSFQKLVNEYRAVFRAPKKEIPVETETSVSVADAPRIDWKN